METREDGVPTFYAKDLLAWRQWLLDHHQTTPSVWLIMYRKNSGTPSIYYDEAVDEALCFGWIDSKPNKRDEESYYQYFSKRNPKSNWSRVNKEKIGRLESEGRIQAAGYAMIEEAKSRGTWTALDEVEQGIIPADLAAAFAQYPGAEANFQAFPWSARRGILEWIFNAKQAATRAKRIRETAEKAAQNIRANQYRN